MNSQSDQELLGAYAERQFEPAFAELVRRHLDFVFSAALRMTRNPQIAEDVAQSVFAALAKQSRPLAWRPVLSGWLHRTTLNLAAKAVRTEVRRRAREQEAAAMNEVSANSEPAWEQLAPHLDAALGALSEIDRNAVILRFINGRSLSEVGTALGTTEEAAKKRVTRALEKLRAHFARRGIAVSASVLALAMTANAIQAAPAGLATTLATGSLAAASSIGTSGLAAGLIKLLLAKAQSKTALLTALVLLGLSGLILYYGSQRVTAESLRKGLVLHFTFDREEADGRVADIGGQGNHGRVSGARWTAAGKEGGAYEFKAGGDRIEVPNRASLNPKEFTLAAWIKTSTQDGTFRRIFDKADQVGYALSIAGDRKDTSWRGLVCLDSVDGFCLSQRGVADGQWHQIVAAYDRTRQWLYVDGQLQAGEGWFQSKGQRLSNSFNLLIGCSRPGAQGNPLGGSFQGLIDEPMMFNRVLSPKEVAFLFAMPKRR